MTRPTSIKIGLAEWTITYGKKTAKGEEVGLTSPAKHTIWVYGGMHEQSIRTTLLHGVMHAIAWTYGFYPGGKDIEEAVVSMFAAPLLTVLQENATLREYLMPS